ncbi:MAG: pyridoxal-dependent decarboxylase [Lentisphaerae bacterium GWF2_57_35]|nr:MAG: pyridoxal-dependent decarboxylase [Lentisphaerae bacterium GWF2_57_35]
MKKTAILILISLVVSASFVWGGDVPMDRLNAFSKKILDLREHVMGYPINQNVDLKEFYEWYVQSGLHNTSMNNVGNPRKSSALLMNTHEFENEVINFFAPLYGFTPEEAWGIVTSSGTDGNDHGVYFGVKYLLAKTQMRPVLYVSEDAHYSIKKIGDLQNLELKLIPSDVMGHMDVAKFEAALETNKPALIVIAIGTTFKGAVDDQKGIDEVLQRKPPLAVYRHLDGALFGGYLPFSEHKEVIDRKLMHFDSIAVSGHKFFGFDEPCGFFITTQDVLDRQNPFRVPYLNDAVPTITCSRSALSPLKFWWKLQRHSMADFQQQAADILANATFFKAQLDEAGYPAWRNPNSNTVFFKRPSQAVMERYDLAMEEDPRLGGLLAHMIVMQNESREEIEDLAASLKADMAKDKAPAKP